MRDGSIKEYKRSSIHTIIYFNEIWVSKRGIRFRQYLINVNGCCQSRVLPLWLSLLVYISTSYVRISIAATPLPSVAVVNLQSGQCFLLWVFFTEVGQIQRETFSKKLSPRLTVYILVSKTYADGFLCIREQETPPHDLPLSWRGASRPGDPPFLRYRKMSSFYSECRLLRKLSRCS
ncbi:unnamed protein product, partial [Nesidiocoris tenuis]